MDFLKGRKDLGNVNIEKEWKCILTEDEIKKCVQECARVINDKFEGKDIVLTCILKGAAYFLVDLSRELIIPHSIYFIEASSYHDSQKQENTEILSLIVPEKFKDKHVILLDELFDNGNTLENVKKAIHEKANVPLEKIFTCTLLKKNKISSREQPDLYGLIVPDVWLVGYGLDDQQHKRGWKCVFACPKAKNITETQDDKIFTNMYYYARVKHDINDQIDEFQ